MLIKFIALKTIIIIIFIIIKIIMRERTCDVNIFTSWLRQLVVLTTYGYRKC